MFEIRKGFHIKTLEEVKKEHKKELINDVATMQQIRNYTNDLVIIGTSIKLENKILNNESFTKKDVKDFYNLYYLDYLKNYFPLNYNTIDKIKNEYDYLLAN